MLLPRRKSSNRFLPGGMNGGIGFFRFGFKEVLLKRFGKKITVYVKLLVQRIRVKQVE